MYWTWEFQICLRREFQYCPEVRKILSVYISSNLQYSQWQMYASHTLSMFTIWKIIGNIMKQNILWLNILFTINCFSHDDCIVLLHCFKFHLLHIFTLLIQPCIGSILKYHLFLHIKSFFLVNFNDWFGLSISNQSRAGMLDNIFPLNFTLP